MKKAEITAFLSLVFILTVSFVLGILEVSVIHTTKNLNRLAADRAVFSVFGEYHGKLLEDYHVFAIEGSYGTGEYSDERLIGRMRYYGTAGMEQEITGIQYLTDLNGQAFREQVLQYMEERYGLSLIRDFTGLTSRWEEQAIQGEEMEETEGNILDEVNDLMENAQFPEEDGAADTQENQDTDLEGPETDVVSPDSEGVGDLTEGGPFTCIEEIEKSGLLSVVMPGKMKLSGRQVVLERQASYRKLRKGRGSFPMRQSMDGIEEKLLFGEYVLKYFENAAIKDSENADPEEEKDSGSRSLAYEVEYILEGKKSDKENLEAVLLKIFLIRMALNYTYIMTDTQRQGEAKALGTTISLLLLNPEAAEAVSGLILLAWAAGESVVDIRTLLSGNKAPLIKNSENWQTSLFSLFSLGTGSEDLQGKDTEDGISYTDYLRAFLFLENTDKVTMRTIDRVEENLSVEKSMDFFRADQCITKLETVNTVIIYGDITYQFPAYFGYE